jgi:hypothetical protein
LLLGKIAWHDDDKKPVLSAAAGNSFLFSTPYYALLVNLHARLDIMIILSTIAQVIVLILSYQLCPSTGLHHHPDTTA